MNLDVLFINPGNHKGIYQGLAKEFTAVDVPVWTLLLTEGLRNKGLSVGLYDVNVEGWSEDKCKKLFEEYSPAIVVLMVYGHHPSASTQTMPAARMVVNSIKKMNNNILVVLGGTHPTSLPKKTLSEEKCDYIISGEGLFQIEGLLHFVKGKVGLDSVKGIWYRKNNEAVYTGVPNLIKDLDRDLPGYSIDLLGDINNYRAHNWHCFQDFKNSKKSDFSDVRSPYFSLYTSLGCPFNCHYCCINSIFQKPGIRYWSIDRVLIWIDELINKYKVRNIRIADELFILKPERVEYFCDKLIERNYNLNFWVYARVDTVKEHLLKKMKKAGINWLCLGIESGNEEVLKGVNKKIGSSVFDVVKLIQDNGISIIGNYMFGLPDDNLKTMKSTLDLAKELNCEFANFYTVMPYPGSKLYIEEVVKKNFTIKDWSQFSQHSFNTTPLPTKYLQSGEVLKFRDNAFNDYFTNPNYLQMVENKFGKVTVKHLQKILKIKLDRELY